ncbi:MAG TPA: S9 family peptidase [Thermoanaerobaculia bacterium]|jgi:dipeptidyl aminopeptidase/acylaminoacyl peptidase
MHFRFRAVFALLLFFALRASAPGASPRPFRFDELAKAGRVGSFSLSPDGQWLAYSVGTPDVEENRTATALWIQATPGGEPRKLTSGEKRDSDPKLSPDGKRLAFLSNRDGGSQIYVLDLSGGEPMKATSFPADVSGLRWSPDGKWFVFTANVFPDCADAACNEKKFKEREKSKTKARVAERLLFRHWDAWKDGLRTHIWKAPVSGPASAAVDLTPGDRDAPPFSIEGGDDYDVSPDGKDFVYALNPDRVEALSTNGDIWMVRFDGKGEAKDLTTANKAYDGTPKFSPDGKWIAYRAQKRPGFESDKFTLMLSERATGKTRSLTENFDEWVEAFTWAPDSRSIYFTSNVGARGAIFRVGLEGKPAEIWRGGSASGLAASRDGRRIYFLSASLSRAAEIWSAGANGKGANPVTHVNDGLFKEVEMGEVSERTTGSADGRNLHAWLVKPPGFDPSKKYPAVFLVHGGPQGAWTDGWSTRWNPQVWAAYGYVVYAANPRGSTGFGQKFVDEISGDWGGKVYDDLMRQADDLASLPFVDKSRIGAAGASYGGYMIGWIAGHTDRFKALISHDGTFDTVSSNLETEELWFPVWEFKGWPWDSDLYAKWNPMLFTKNFKTPTLVITSEKDYRVPFGQGLQFFTALQVRGVPSKLLTFPDEGHWVLKPGNSRLWHATVMDWLHQYLGGAAPDAKALETAYSVTK